ncbi:MAG: hypothetical protein M1477_02045 [Candidatus Thermoplasmatota archaeon]|nr:hypothetical protein [Candidatus Thermoplasmatota archaeon]
MTENKTLSEFAGQRMQVVFVNVIGHGDSSAIRKPEFYLLRFGRLVKCYVVNYQVHFYV